MCVTLWTSHIATEMSLKTSQNASDEFKFMGVPAINLLISTQLQMTAPYEIMGNLFTTKFT